MTGARRARVVCVGHAALDRIFTVEHWPECSAKIAASAYEETGGGMMANAAVSISRLGGAAVFCGPTGDDAIAATIRAHLQAEGVDVTHLRGFPGMTSSHSAVLVDARGERLVVGYRGSALQAPADWLPRENVLSASAVLADVRWPQGAEAALSAARRARVPAILDGESAPPEVLEKLCTVADHVVFSERGLAELAGLDVEGGLRRALEAGVRISAVTRGEAGVFWLEAGAPHELHHCPAFEVAAIDTLAAGDVFHGAYALSIAEGAAVAEAMRFASAAAAIKCTRPGGRSGAPTRAEVEALLAS
jgi:sulfofructose kinase